MEKETTLTCNSVENRNIIDFGKWWVESKDYSQLTDCDVIHLADLVEFSIVKVENETQTYYKAIDSQGANLGGVEEEEFNTLQELAERLETYFNDYLGDRDIFSVWVGGNEVNDYFLNIEEARELADKFKKEGYSDVVIQNMSEEEE